MASTKRFEPTPEQRAMIEGKIDVVIGGLASERGPEGVYGGPSPPSLPRLVGVHGPSSRRRDHLDRLR